MKYHFISLAWSFFCWCFTFLLFPGDIEQIKRQYREQTERWNKHLDDSRREADERLQKLLAQHSK